MAISDHYKTDFTYSVKSESKVNGQLVRGYTPEGNTYKCAIFSKSSVETVVYASAEFVISKVLYCPVSIGFDLGDIIIINGVEYDVVRILDTNNIGHHLQVGLSTRNV